LVEDNAPFGHFAIRASGRSFWSILPNQIDHTARMKSAPSTVTFAVFTVIVVDFVSALYWIKMVSFSTKSCAMGERKRSIFSFTV